MKFALSGDETNEGMIFSDAVTMHVLASTWAHDTNKLLVKLREQIPAINESSSSSPLAPGSVLCMG